MEWAERPLEEILWLLMEPILSAGCFAGVGRMSDCSGRAEGSVSCPLVWWFPLLVLMDKVGAGYRPVWVRGQQ